VNLSLVNKQQYYWKARAFDGYFYSNWMDAVSFVYDTSAVTAVELEDFWGIDNDGTVCLGWLTAFEEDVEGFNIYRKMKGAEKFERINDNPLAGNKGSYNFVDHGVKTGKIYFYYLEYLSKAGYTERFNEIEVFVSAPKEYKLYANYPNPFNAHTTIKFDLPLPGNVQIRIYNILGQEVRALINRDFEAGYHSAVWDGADAFGRQVASGVYIYRIAAQGFVKARKMVMIK